MRTLTRSLVVFLLASGALGLVLISSESCSGPRSDVSAASVASATPPASVLAEFASGEAPRLAAPLFADAARHDVMESARCAGCHPDQYAEHEQSTHGRAFTDEEVRLATARFSHQDCIICHTPRPIFESGIGMNPIKRHYGLEEGNTCMTCHWKPNYDYAKFEGGLECKVAFHPDVGKVEACASCHRNHGTPYQWERNPNGKASGRVCIDCHMKSVDRPIAVGGPVREVHSHIFPGGRNEEHLRRAYSYDVNIEGDHVVVTIKNKGAGHNFPTELKQRSVESLVIVRDLDGNVVGRSRMIFRDPYKRPYGLELPVNTQIPGGQTREQRVPIKAAAGTIECELYYKLYYPIEDNHPDLARRLELRTLPFTDVTPSSEDVVTEIELAPKTPEGVDPSLASPANLVDYAHPTIAKVAVDIPSGETAEDIQHLIELFQFPVPEANGKARKRLTELGTKAVPALVEALGSWDNKTWNQAQQVLEAIGAPAKEAVAKALGDERLYVRLHARELAPKLALAGDAAAPDLLRGLAAENGLDRSSSAVALGALGLKSAAPKLRERLLDPDPDVVRDAALALAKLGDAESVAAIRAALPRARYDETRRDLAIALGRLGSPDGIPVLLAGLDHKDDLIRESFFEAFFDATAKHLGYEPLAPRDVRLAAVARLQGAWAKDGGAGWLVKHTKPDAKAAARAVAIVTDIGGSDMKGSTPDDDAAMINELVDIGEDALPALVNGLKWASGFADKRAAICNVLGQIASKRSVPALCDTLRDPVVHVAAVAAWALERTADPEARPALFRYEQRLLSLAASGRLPAEAGMADALLAQAARTRLLLGDDTAKTVLAAHLLSPDPSVRQLAIGGLKKRYGEDRGFDPLAPLEDQRKAAVRWMK